MYTHTLQRSRVNRQTRFWYNHTFGKHFIHVPQGIYLALIICSFLGTWAVVSIMTGDAIDSIVSVELTNRDGRANFDEETELRIQVAISLCLLVGIIQVPYKSYRIALKTLIKMIWKIGKTTVSLYFIYSFCISISDGCQMRPFRILIITG